MGTSIQKTILLVEDEIITAMASKQALEKYGYNAITVTSGEKAIKYVNNNTGVNLILMDIDLGGGIDGTQAAEQILSKHDIPIVFLSSHTEPDVVEKTEKITSYGYVVKNSSITVLDASIKMAFKLFDAKIKEQKSEAILRENEERFQMLFNNAPLGYQSLDIDGNFIEVNQQWLDTLGYDREEVIGQWFGDFLTPNYQDGFRKRFPIFKAQGHIHSEFEMMHKNGTILFIAFEGKIGHTPTGDFKQTHCILQDITEKKRADEKLAVTIDYYQTLLEKATDGIVLLDGTGNFKYISPTAKNMFGYDVSEEIPGNPAAYTHPDEVEMVLQNLMQLLSDTTYSPTLQYRFMTKSGEWKWVESIFTNLLHDATVQAIVINFRDITAQKKAEHTKAPVRL